MYYDFYTHVNNAYRYNIFGGLVPTNEVGAYFIYMATLPLLALYILQKRVSEERLHWLIVGTACVSLLGTYIGSCRWLDDLNVNLVHTYNLLHHGRFSVSPSHMVNGTVELVYYALLTPFAWTQGSLLMADYIFGYIIAALHLVLLAHMLRPYSLPGRLVSLLGFSVIFPLIQNFSSGYGNALVSLVAFWGFYNLLANNIKWAYFCAALLPALRPDAVLYTGALVLADMLIHRKIRILYWLLTPSLALVYLGVVKLMYGFYIPTPMLLKQVSIRQMIGVLPQIRGALGDCIISGNAYTRAMFVFAVLFFCLRTPDGSLLTKRRALIWLAMMFPVLVFFKASGMFGYNPTLSRYYVGWETAYTVVAIAGLAAQVSLIDSSYEKQPTEGCNKVTLLRAPWVICGCVCLIWLSGATLVSLSGADDGRALGIEMNSSDLKRFPDLIYASKFLADVLPADWRIAVTEMDTFGFFNGREIVDLWGFSNRDIANSNIIAKNPTMPIKIRPTELVDSNAEVFWIRTLSGSGPIMNAKQLFRSPDPAAILPAYVSFPNLNPSLDQAGNPAETLKKYDIVRVFHDTAYTTILLVRKDLTARLVKLLEAHGNHLHDSGELDMEGLEEACQDWDNEPAL